jgi:hypothetical protein
MPPAIDYRDLPESFQEGDFPMNVEILTRSLPAFAELVIGDLEHTFPAFLAKASAEAPIGFVAIDVDYYSSATKALRILLQNQTDIYRLSPFTLTTSEWMGLILGPANFLQ